MSPSPPAAAWLFALDLARPGVLWALALAVPLVLLHLYHRRRVIVPYLPLLREAVGRRRPGGGWRRVRDQLPLALRLLALVALVLALAGVGPTRSPEPHEGLVLVVDADVTTLTVEEDGRTRYEHALDLASAWVRSRAWRGTTLIEARAAPLVLRSSTSAKNAAERLDRLAAETAEGRRSGGPGTSDLDAALALAAEVGRRRSPSRVVLVSSRAQTLPDPEPGLAYEAIQGPGRTREDAGFTGLGLSPAADGVRSTVSFRVRNAAAEERTRTLEIRLGDEILDRRSLRLEPEGEAEGSLALLPPRGGAWLRLALVERDAFHPNDRVSAWLAPPARPSVLVVHGGAVRPYTRAILEAMGEDIDAEASATVHASDLAQAEPRDITVVDGAALPSGSVQPGAWIFLAPLSGELPFAVGEPLTEPLVWRSAPDHPLVRDVDLATAYVARGYPVSGEGLERLAQADDATVLGEGRLGGVRYVVLGLDPDASDLPVRAALPLLVRNAVRRLAATPLRPFRAFYRPGERLRPRIALPGGPSSIVRWNGSSRSVRLDPAGDTWLVPPGARGEVDIETHGPDGQGWRGQTAFVDVDPSRTIAPARPMAKPPTVAAARGDVEARWRRALLVFALCCLLLDLLLVAADRAAARKLAEGR